MGTKSLLPWLLAVQLAGTSATSGQASTPEDAAPVLPSEALVASLEPSALSRLAADVLDRNPDVARARQRVVAAYARVPQARSWPDPTASLTLFLLPPETRVGPQQLAAAVSQRFPWFGKLALAERAALLAAAQAETEVETRRLDLVTETRRLFYQLAFQDRYEEIVRTERRALVRYEEAARARYAAGTGLQQEIVRIQAQITRTDQRLLEIAERRATLQALLNALRDWPADFPIEGLDGLVLPSPPVPSLDGEELRNRARAARPEIAAADAEIARRDALAELAAKSFKPDFTLGVGYTVVGRRDDAQARAVPPEGNGNDILAFTGSVALPVRRKRLEAGLEEALAEKRAAEEAKRRVLAEVERGVGDLRARLPLLYEHWSLLDRVLRVQAAEALRSAETAYTTGRLGAVDLLDAEVVLFEVRIATARTLTDYLVAWAELERAVAAPLFPNTEDSDHDR